MNPETTSSAETRLPSVDRPRRRWVTLLLALMIFVAGFVCGVGLTIVTAVHRLQYAIHHPEDAPARVATTLKRKLGLDEKQRGQIEEIIARRQVDLNAIRREFQPKVVDQLTQIRDEISGVLNETQREHFTKMFDDIRDRWMPPIPPEAKSDKGSESTAAKGTKKS
jgi:cell division protein FtsB